MIGSYIENPHAYEQNRELFCRDGRCFPGRDKSKVYEAFVLYYGDPDFVKIKHEGQGNNQHGIYAVQIACQLGVERRYLLLTVEGDANSIGSQVPLSQLLWDSFQTRTIETEMNVPTVSYPKKLSNVMNEHVSLVDRHNMHTEYESDVSGLRLSLLHKKQGDAFPNEGHVKSALETFRTVVTL